MLRAEQFEDVRYSVFARPRREERLLTVPLSAVFALESRRLAYRKDLVAFIELSKDFSGGFLRVFLPPILRVE